MVALDEERAAIKRALSALDPDPAERTSDLPRHRILALVEQEPGIRASLVAMHCKLPADLVVRELTQLEAMGDVRREGLGWAKA